MVSSGRYPKSPIANALAAVGRPGLEVEPIHRGHRWGATVCSAELAIWSTPRVPEDTARAIHRFDQKHRTHDVGDGDD
jgi:hypothetical protein